MATAQLSTPPRTDWPASGELTPDEFTDGIKSMNAEVIEEQMTPDEFVRLKIKHAELINGKVKKLMPTMLSHDRLAFIIAMRLENFVNSASLGVDCGWWFFLARARIRFACPTFRSLQLKI